MSPMRYMFGEAQYGLGTKCCYMAQWILLDFPHHPDDGNKNGLKWNKAHNKTKDVTLTVNYT